MKLIIHDLEETDFLRLVPAPYKDMIIISNNGSIGNCIGCFGCWIKTPGACVIRDEFGNMGEYISKCEEVHIISQCFYGGLSPFIKNVIDRSISYVHPYFEMRKGEMHHRPRYNKKFNLKVWFYGNDITREERETARKLVCANALNLNSSQSSVSFYQSINDLEDITV